MDQSRGNRPADRDGRRKELVDQLERIEAERRNPHSALGPEVLAAVAGSLRSLIEQADENENDDEFAD